MNYFSMEVYDCLPSLSPVAAIGNGFELYRAAQSFTSSIALIRVAAIFKGGITPGRTTNFDLFLVASTIAFYATPTPRTLVLHTR